MAGMVSGWMNSFKNPTRASYAAWKRGQQGQYDPIIKALTNQYALSGKKDEVVGSYEKLIGALPSREQISSGYGSAMDNLANYIQGVDVARAGKGVREAVNAIGGAIGADAGATSDVASGAGMVSGVGTAGGDVFSKTILGGAQARLSGLEAERLGAREQQQVSLGLGLGEAKKAATDYRRQLGLQVAEAKGKKTAAMPNPLDESSSIMKFLALQKEYNASGKGFGKGSGTSSGGGWEDLYKNLVQQIQNQKKIEAAASASAVYKAPGVSQR